MPRTPEQQVEDLQDKLETTTAELDEANRLLAKPPEWGNCRRGCPPAYLDRDRYCSPACKLGQPRGEFPKGGRYAA